MLRELRVFGEADGETRHHNMHLSIRYRSLAPMQVDVPVALCSLEEHPGQAAISVRGSTVSVEL